MDGREPQDSPPARFVVGTGRCGSTLLSRMLAQHGGVLSLFELFSGIEPSFAFRDDIVSGAELATRLEEDHPMLTMVLSRGYDVPEVAYPFDAKDVRYGRSDPIPWTLAIAVARVADDPDALFDEMLAVARSQPDQPLALHYRNVLAWLTRRCGRALWIEKSGSSMGFAADLARLFPEARFVHLRRDPFETALSMREYSVLRLAVPVMYGELGEVDYSHAGLRAFEERHRDEIDAILAGRPRVELYGRYWSDQVGRGLPVLEQLDPDSVLDVRFEDLVTRPTEVMEGIAGFFGMPADAGWVDRAAALVKGLPEARFEGLAPRERRRLEEACAPGIAVLERYVAARPG